MSTQPRYQGDEDPRDGRMGFLDHLDELRKRIIRSCDLHRRGTSDLVA